MLRLKLETGRTHQIRVHLEAIGHPVIGDKTYGNVTRVGAPRTFLHASQVEFGHPANGDRISVDSPLAPDLKEVLEVLGNGQ